MTRLYLKRPEIITISGKSADVIVDGLKDSYIINGPDILSGTGSVRTLEYGEEFVLEKIRIILLENKLILMSEDDNIRTTLRILDEDELFDGFPDYTRSPRIIKRVEPYRLRLQSPKPLPSKKKGELIQLILPPLGMLAVTIAISILMHRGIFVLMSVAGTGMTLIVSVARYITGRRDIKAEKSKRVKAYEDYLLRKRKEMFSAYELEREAYEHNYPDLRRISEMVNGYSPRIYERSPMDEDFLKVSVGEYEDRSSIVTDFQNEETVGEEDPLVSDARELINEFSVITKPVVIDFKNAHTGLVGQKSVIHEQINILLAQITCFHSYHDLEVILVYNKDSDNDFSWLRWYPHLRIHALNCSGLINNERKRDQILGSINQIIKERKVKIDESNKDSMFLPHFLFIIDDPKMIIDHSIMEYLGEYGYNLGFSIIYTTQMRANLPENIGTIIEFLNSEDGKLILEEKNERNVSFNLQRTGDVDLEWMARNLSALNHQQGVSARIPDSITFFKMYGIDKPSQLDIIGRWKRNDSSRSLAVPLGARAENDYVYLNLHEKAHGPHGLVAGTTGSGKSEIIQSYILSLAVNFSPYEVAFLLIDYKGGGMANLFRKLPHLLGTITNLDGSSSMRAMSSIKAELSRRQNIFNEYQVNHINGYNRLVKTGKAKEPLPHLFIISDEFAELKKEQPDFMKELVSAARIGRSLGVHLILATQKPAGVIDDQIWSNSKFKLALKVQSEADSKEILKTADAANITQTGRAYLQVGNNEIYELFQSAWSGAAYDEEKQTEKKDDRVYIVNELGQGELVNRDLSDNQGESGLNRTQLDVIVDYIHDFYEKLDTIPITRPWLPPLENQILSPSCKREPASQDPDLDLEIDIGLIDIPDRQAQEEYTVNPADDGNILFVAARGFGKTFFLTTCALSLAMRNSVDNINFYILDFGNSGLIQLKKLHHTADYISFDDSERRGKFIRIIEREIADRKRKFAESAVQSLDGYNRSSGKKMRAIVILIDNMDTFKDLDYEEEDFYQKAFRDGPGLGIYFIGTVSRSNGIKYGMLSHFRNKICGFVVDESDVSAVVGRTSYKQTEIRGRAFAHHDDSIDFMQIYTMAECTNEIQYSSGINTLIERINSVYPDKVAPKIPVLPENLDYAEFSSLVDKYRSGDEVYIGLDSEWVVPCHIQKDQTPFLIIGESRKGKTNALRVILEQITGKGAVRLYDSNALDLYSYSVSEGVEYFSGNEGVSDFTDWLTNTVEERTAELNKLLAEQKGRSPKDILISLPSVYVVIDDIDDFINQFNASDQAKAGAAMTDAATAGVTFIVTANAGRFKGFDGISKFIKNTTYGLMVGGQGNSNVFPLASAKDNPRFKDGLLWNGGEYISVRIPQHKEG